MQQNLITKKISISKICLAAILAALIAGLLTHFFVLVNPVHNHDDIAVQPYGSGSGIALGRWFLSLLAIFSFSLGGLYNLPWVNGLIFIGFIAISSGFLVSVLKLRKCSSAILIGAIMAVFPAVTSTLYYRFTSPFYGIAILLSVLAVWVLGRCKYSWLLSAICTALSLGIYQSFVSITIAAFVLILIQYALSGKADWLTIIRRGLFYCFTLILGAILYYVCLRVLLSVYNMQLSDYKGLDQMGAISLRDLPALILSTFRGPFQLTYTDYYGLSFHPVTQKLYLLSIVISLALLAYILVKRVRKADVAALTVLLCLTFPIAANFIHIVCQSGIYTLMLYGLVMIPCFPIVVLESLDPEQLLSEQVTGWIRGTIVAALSIIILFYSYEANVSYMSMYFSTRQTENYFNSMVAQIRMTDGFTAEKKWAFLGNINDPLLDGYWDDETRFGGNRPTEVLINHYSRTDWITQYIGYTVPLQSQEIIDSLIARDEVRKMPCWPDAGSIRVVGDTVVIKFEELSDK